MVRWLKNSTGRGVVSCDWFALSCCLCSPRGDRPLAVPDGWSCVLMPPTAVWADRFFILDHEGNKVATLLMSPRSPAIDERRCVIEVANRFLYYDDFESVVDCLLDCLPMTITGLNRVDLCCDFEMTDALWRTYSRLAAGRAYIKALKCGSVWWQSVVPLAGDERAVRMPHCLNFGGVESIFKWKIYYKWLELQQAPVEGKKPYISDLWAAMGFYPRAVWRVEVSVHGSNRLACADGNPISAMNWYRDRVSIFSNIYADKFVVRLDEGHADKRNDEVLPFLDVVGGKMLWHALPKNSRDDSDAERRLTVKLWNECRQNDVRGNSGLYAMLKSNLCELLERPANVHALKSVCNATMDDIVAMMND